MGRMPMDGASATYAGSVSASIVNHAAKLQLTQNIREFRRSSMLHTGSEGHHALAASAFCADDGVGQEFERALSLPPSRKRKREATSRGARFGELLQPLFLKYMYGLMAVS